MHSSWICLENDTILYLIDEVFVIVPLIHLNIVLIIAFLVVHSEPKLSQVVTLFLYKNGYNLAKKY